MPRGGRKNTNGAEFLTEKLCAAYAAGDLSKPEHMPPPSLHSVPPPQSFNSLGDLYDSARALCLTEAMAMVRDGLRGSHSKPSASIRLKMDYVQRAADRKSAKLGAMCFKIGGGGASADDLRAGSVFLLRSRLARDALLGVIDGRDTLRFEVLDTSLHALCEQGDGAAVVTDSPWMGTCVASVLLQQRCIDTCIRQPKLPFVRALLGCSGSDAHSV